MMVVCSTESADNTCTKATAFAQAGQNAGVRITVSPQALSSSGVNSQLGISTAYTDTVATFIESIL
jgi:hypothetical protein